MAENQRAATTARGAANAAVSQRVGRAPANSSLLKRLIAPKNVFARIKTRRRHRAALHQARCAVVGIWFEKAGASQKRIRNGQ